MTYAMKSEPELMAAYAVDLVTYGEVILVLGTIAAGIGIILMELLKR